MNINTAVYENRWGEEYSDPNPIPSGLLSPDGTFYVCQDSEHQYLAEAIVDGTSLYDAKDELLINRGWLRIAARGQAYITAHSNKSITQAQLDTLFDLYVSIRNVNAPIALATLRRILNITVQE